VFLYEGDLVPSGIELGLAARFQPGLGLNMGVGIGPPLTPYPLVIGGLGKLSAQQGFDLFERQSEGVLLRLGEAVFQRGVDRHFGNSKVI